MASAMYHLPPILDMNLEVCLPSCMYQMAPIVLMTGQQPKASVEVAAVSGAAATDLAQLESRQEAILTRLMTLKSQVETARQQLGSNSSSVHVALATAASRFPVHGGEVVVVASPASPPFSLLLLRRLVPALTVTGHVHSSAPAVSASMAGLFRWTGAEGGPHLRLIWKDVDGEPSLLVSAAGQPCPLVGEDQLCRYLARALLPHHYEGGDAARAATVDHLMEEAARLRSGSGKDKQTVLRSLNTVLGRQPYLLGSEPTLVDGVVWSALRVAALQSPPIVTAWQLRLDEAAGLGANRSTSARASGPSTDVERKPPGSSAAAALAASSAQLAAAAARQASEAANHASGAAKHALAAAAAVPRPAPPGGDHLDQAGLLALLERLGAQAETVSHPAVFTVEEMMPHLAAISGAVTKNLFLRDKKKALYVLSTRHDADFRLADVARQVAGAKEFRFGDEAVMWELLGVRQGCVTALALANDRQNKVRLLVDAKLLDGTYDRVWFHPLSNEATTGLSVADFRRFLDATGHEPLLVQV